MDVGVNSPDRNSQGFLKLQPKADRYENASSDIENVAYKIARFVPKGAYVLDIGCGTGSVSEVIQHLTSAKILGVEPDSTRVALGRERGINVVEGLVSDNMLKEKGPFDVVVFADVLEHLPDPAEVVRLAMTGLKPDGIIIASVPNVAHWFVRSELLRGRFQYTDCGIMDATHLRWFTLKTLGQFFDNLGCSTIGIDFTVNIDMREYHTRKPWKWIGGERKKRLVRFLVKMAPTIFGCQIVICAKPRSGRD